MISIVIPVKDNKYYTELCINSVFKNTKQKYELIVVDNGSKEKETIDYLDSLDCKLIRNKENKGCAGAWNQGINASSGEYVCIINNDILVPENWLLNLKKIYEKNNYVLISPSMREGELTYDLEEYNKEFSTLLSNRFFKGEYRGVCLFASLDFFKSIGGFDENFEKGKFEDEDLFMRIKKIGMNTAVTTSVLVHHYGSKTINKVKSENNGFEDKNRIYFRNKWKHKYIFRKFNKIRINLRRKWIKLKYKLDY
jgi:N-acetylglucosaminyl-diphospho-decaprenol L-rhamnosyltransferase